MRRTPNIFALLCVVIFAVACGDSGPGLISNNDNNQNNANNNNGDLKQDGESCTDAGECVSKACTLGACSSATCTDGAMNGDESDVDCGTIGCAKCDIGKACGEDLDCVSGICNDETCRDMNCSDGMKNGLETDLDCGGLCGPCVDGLGCVEVSDCVSNVCEDDVCATPTCDDGEANGTETDVDCGGPCDPCSDGAGCSNAGDCASAVCTGGACAVPACTDSATNADETDVDCGGSDCPTCDDNRNCKRDSDCTSQICDDTTKKCAVPACDDNEQNGDETDKDCGGSCNVCDPGKRCTMASDCVSGICGGDNKCTRPACDDGVTNDEETDVDCGGDRCESCDDAEICVENDDCLSRVCTGGVCAAGQCNDGQQNAEETDIDCGGSVCSPCADGEMCAGENAYCTSGVCSGTTCRAPTCRDAVQNGGETDVDCGGPDCADACEDYKGCGFGSDCASLVCHPVTNTCEPARCDDGVQNATETDVDCGATCPAQCQLGEMCVAGNDCDTTICDGGQIGPICAACTEGSYQLLNTRCGYGNRGQVQQTCTDGIWVNDTCEGVWYGSCREILTDSPQSMDGNYDIDPDGPDPLYDEFEVYCDMSTSGGGWTQILLCTAKNELRGELVGIDQAQVATFEGCKPKTRDEADGHTYHYSFDFPSGYQSFRFDDMELRANADDNAGDTSDLGFVQTSWSAATSTNVNRGDISFGSAGGSPTTSYSRMLGNRSCTDCTLQWPTNQNGPFNIGATSNKFRIGFGESGSQAEGWYPWWDGAIYLR